MLNEQSPADNFDEPRAATSTDSRELERQERRRLIKSLIGSVPVVLTVTAGTARAQGGSASDVSGGQPEQQNEPEASGDSAEDPTDRDNIFGPGADPYKIDPEDSDLYQDILNGSDSQTNDFPSEPAP